jgi:hypothetical protein
MTTGELAFLALVIVVFLAFAATLAYYSQR